VGDRGPQGKGAFLLLQAIGKRGVPAIPVGAHLCATLEPAVAHTVRSYRELASRLSRSSSQRSTSGHSRARIE